jgi:Alpha-glucosidases, family 31 of glycosyl hydrolases
MREISMLDSRFIFKASPKARQEQIILLGNIRAAVLAPELIRIEVSDSLKFLDEPSMIFINRDLGECKYSVEFDDKILTIRTERAEFRYDRKKLRFISVVLEGKSIKCDNKKNLKGTARTLDMSFGPIGLSEGLMSRKGVYVLKDDTLILGADGMVKPRTTGSDEYVFASKDYGRILKLFFEASGKPPLVPRYAFGNWWSRYHAYTADEYLGVMDRFEKEDVPLSVATVDMDWHYVDIKKAFGEGIRRRARLDGLHLRQGIIPRPQGVFQ